MVIVNIKKEDSKKAFKKEAVFKVPKIKGYPTIRIEKGCDFQRNTNFSYSSQPLFLHLFFLFFFKFYSYFKQITIDLQFKCTSLRLCKTAGNGQPQSAALL